MKTVHTETTYLQMLTRPAVKLESPLSGTEVHPLPQPSVDEYRRIYRSVGAAFNWVDRLRMDDDSLLRIIHNPSVEIHELRVENQNAGFCELDRGVNDEVEIAYFGLVPSFIGRGLGKFFLNWTLHQAWSQNVQRVWLHTCDLDHQAALPNYVKAGFEVYDKKIIKQPLEATYPGDADS